MPYQTIGSEIMLALAIWLLAICIFVIMLVLALLEIIAENRARMRLNPRSIPNRWADLRHRATQMFRRQKPG